MLLICLSILEDDKRLEKCVNLIAVALYILRSSPVNCNNGFE